jgi:hypothetical protein
MTTYPRTIRFLSLAALMCGLGSCSDLLEADPDARVISPTLSGRIIFTEALEGGGTQIISMNADSTDFGIVATDGSIGSEPQGGKIVYLNTLGMIVVDNIDGSDPRTVPLPPIDGVIESAVLSITGQIAFS